VNPCQKIFSNPLTIPKTTTTHSQCTPARVVNSTGTARAAAVTGTNARLPKNSVIPAAVAPFRQGQRTSTAAVTGHAASKNCSEFMSCQPEILDLLEQYIEKRGGGEHWLTVQEFRRDLMMGRNSTHVISGILHRIYRNPMFSSSCRVIRIEKIRDPSQPCRNVSRYLIRKENPEMKTPLFRSG